MTFSATPFPVAGVGAFSDASWGDLQVAYYVLTAANAWTSGPANGQVCGNRKFSQFTTPATATNFAYSSLGTVQGQLAQIDGNSYVTRMDLGDTSVNAGFFGGFIPLKNGEQNLADLATTGHVDSYLYYYCNTELSGGRPAGRPHSHVFRWA